jgi:hypothetical protein
MTTNAAAPKQGLFFQIGEGDEAIIVSRVIIDGCPEIDFYDADGEHIGVFDDDARYGKLFFNDLPTPAQERKMEDCVSVAANIFGESAYKAKWVFQTDEPVTRLTEDHPVVQTLLIAANREEVPQGGIMETNITKLLDFTGAARGDKAQATEVTLKYADKEIKVALTYAEVGFLMRGLYEAAEAAEAEVAARAASKWDDEELHSI